MKARPTRRRWQFGLSTLLGAMLFCGGLAWLFTALVVEPYRQEQVIVAELRQYGGRTTLEPIGPAWIDLLDNRYRRRVVAVHLVGPAVDDAVLDRLRMLPHLRQLWLVETATTPAAANQLRRHHSALTIYLVHGFPNPSSTIFFPPIP